MTSRAAGTLPLLPVVCTLACSFALGGCGPAEPEPDEAPPPLVVFALDGLEWRVLLPLLADGRLPTLAGLIERGVAGKLETLKPTKSPRIWTSIATGRTPEDHGILDFVRRPQGDDGPIYPYTGVDRRVKAWWNILSDEGVTNATIGWWATWPVETVDGFMLAPTNTKARREGPIFDRVEGRSSALVHPPALEDEVLAEFDRFDATIDDWMERVFGPLPDELPRGAKGRLDGCSWALRADLTYWSAAHRTREGGERPRCTTIYSGGTDVIAHRFWAAFAPRAFGLAEDSLEVRAFGHMIPAYYEFIDAELGEFLAQEPDVNVLVVSDHGMGRDRTWTRGESIPRLSGLHAWQNAGVLIAAGPSILGRPFPPFEDTHPNQVPRIAQVYDICPTVLALCDVPVGDDMEGDVLTYLLTPEFRAAFPPRSVPTHEDEAWQRYQARRAATWSVGVESTERVEQLDALGYLEGE